MRFIKVCLMLATLPIVTLSASAQMPPPPPPPPIPPELLNQTAAAEDKQSDVASASASVTPVKRALILEYLRVSGRTINPNMAPQFDHIMGLVRAQLPMLSKQAAVGVPGMISRMSSQVSPGGLKASSLTSNQQKAIMEDAQEHVSRMTQRSGELLMQNSELPKVMEDTFVSVYDKYFSEQDLKDIIAFYHTPVGAKLSRQQAAIDKEMMTLSINSSVAPIGKVMQQVQEEEELFAPDRPQPSK